MSSSDGEEQKAKYKFKGKFGAVSLGSHSVVEASSFEVDSFVRDILGLTKNKGTEPTRTEATES
jgi:hypothetical protein